MKMKTGSLYSLGTSLIIPLCLFTLTIAQPCAAQEGLSREELEAFSVSATGAAERFYREKCRRCHGDRGGGDGAYAESLVPRPTDFRSGSWQSRISDEEIRRVLLEGGGALGKSLLMPAFPELRGQVQLLRVLIKKIRRFRTKRPAR